LSELGRYSRVSTEKSVIVRCVVTADCFTTERHLSENWNEYFVPTPATLQLDPTGSLGCRFCLEPPRPVTESGAMLRAGGLLQVSVFDIKVKTFGSY
jgi:hypothetical protein